MGAVAPAVAPVAEAPTAPRTAATSHAAPAASAAGIQRIKDRWGPPSASVMLFHDRVGQFASQMRSLRANIAALNNGAPPRIITVTSAGREEGKTTVCANLAAALGEVETGRIIVVDGDIVQPSLHLTMNVRVQSGLRAVLQEGLKLDGRIYETAIPNVDILPSFGIGPDEGLEAPLHQRCAQLLALLRKHYAYVIIDTPPVLAGSPAATFAKHSDGVILVARLEKTPREVVKRTADDLTDAGAKLIGCVLTHQKHHVPDIIYRFLGTTPTHYYRYGRDRRAKGAGAEAPQAKAGPLQQVKSSETE
jgi:capsular exopolysaccharide synthesis family protein